MAHRWLTGYAPLEWRTAYTHVIRAPDDPDEKDTRGHDGTRQRRWGMAPHKVIATMDPDRIVDVLISTLGDEAMTFNALSVRAFDLTADITYDTRVDRLLWDLVEEGVLEHTEAAPVLFRRRRG